MCMIVYVYIASFLSFSQPLNTQTPKVYIATMYSVHITSFSLDSSNTQGDCKTTYIGVLSAIQCKQFGFVHMSTAKAELAKS